MRKNKTIGLLCVMGLTASLLEGCGKEQQITLVPKENLETQSDTIQQKSDEAATDHFTSQIVAPSHYQNEVKDETGKLTVSIDAEVIIPEVSTFYTYEVTERPFDQAFIDNAMETFFGDSTIINMDDATKLTKSEIEELIQKNQEMLATGNYDYEAFGYAPGDDTGKADMEANCKTAIKELEAMYETATDTNQPLPSKPTLENQDYYSGIVTVDDTHKYDIRLQNFNGLTMQIEKDNAENSGNQEVFWIDSTNSQNDSFCNLTQEDIQNLETETKEAAQQKTDQIVEKLGFSDMELASWDYIVKKVGSEMTQQTHGCMKHFNS